MFIMNNWKHYPILKISRKNNKKGILHSCEKKHADMAKTNQLVNDWSLIFFHQFMLTFFSRHALLLYVFFWCNCCYMFTLAYYITITIWIVTITITDEYARRVTISSTQLVSSLYWVYKQLESSLGPWWCLGDPTVSTKVLQDPCPRPTIGDKSLQTLA